MAPASPVASRQSGDRAPTIVAALRTPIGTAGKALAGVEAADLAAPVLARLSQDVAPRRVSTVVLGNCTGPGGNLARVAALEAGLPVEVAALSLDHQCGSGLAAILTGAALHPGGDTVVLAGGVESASTAPTRIRPDGTTYSRAPFAPARLGDPEMGAAAEDLAEREGISRERQDAYAARSHQRALDTQRTHGFDAEIVPVGTARVDQRPRSLTRERLARLRPAWREQGTVTAGNSCGINDGAAAVAIADGGPGLRIRSSAICAVDPRLPGIGLVPAVRQALAEARLSLEEIDVVEFNEAFAGQILACCRHLGLDPERVCPEGGALALGHPWGASGAVLAVRLWTQLIDRGRGRFGLAGIAVGGGQGVAMVVQACP